LNLLPNAAHVLTKLGFNFQRALVGKHLRLETVNGITLESLTLVDLTNVEKEYGGDVQSILRADLHSELLLLSQQGPNPASLHLGSLVKRVDSTEGTVELESGAVHTADLIIAADGAHSVCRQEVLGYDQPSVGSGKSAFRFLIPSETIEKSEPIKEFLQGRAPGATILADVQDKLKTRHLTWYECHG
jgi:salicylate hydroxylase